MTEPVKPKDAAQYLDIVRQVTPETYHVPVLADPEAAALFRAMARVQALVARRGYEIAQARFIRTHSTADADPASSYRFASGLVRMRRTFDLQDQRYVAPGAMILVGPSGRRYWNYASQTWTPGDSRPEKEFLFVCTVPGLVGNIDHLADDAGLITLEGKNDAPNSEPDLDLVDHADLSEGRTGFQATIMPPANYKACSVIRDSGKPDQFSATHRGIYVRIDAADFAENVGRVLNIRDVRFPQTENPTNSGLFPNEVEVDDLPLPVPPKAVLLDDGGVFTDYTLAASDDVPDDVELLPAIPAPGDALYIGLAEPFLGIAVAITTAGVGTYSLVWEYWDGALWQPWPAALLHDDTQQFELAGELRVEFEQLPLFWSQVAVNGITAFWIRARVDVGGATVQPLAAKIKALKWQRLTPEVGSVQWSALDWKDLGFRLTQIEAFSGGRDNTLALLGDERGLEQKKNESDDEFRARVGDLADVVTPAAILRIVNRALAPYQLQGIARDTQNGITGLFCDVDACDYYTPGDLFPTDPVKLLYTDALSYGGFEVVVPYLSDGDVGMSCDDGPIVYLEPEQTYLGPACDCCFLDGNAGVKAEDVYDSIYESVSEAKLFGVDWIMRRDLTQNASPC